MYRLHDRRKNAKRQFGDSRQSGLYDYRESAKLQGENAAKHRGEDDFLSICGVDVGSCKKAASHYRPVYKKISDEASVESHVPDVCAKRQKSAVRKEKALDGEDDYHRKEARIRAEQGCEHHASAKVARRASARDCVIYHLACEDKGRHYGHSRKLAFRKPADSASAFDRRLAPRKPADSTSKRSGRRLFRLSNLVY